MFEMITAPKKIEAMKYEFMRNRGYDLEDVYGRCSAAKKSAWMYYRHLCAGMNGTNFHITSANSNFFSVMWSVTERRVDGIVYEMLFRATGKSETFTCTPMI